MDDTSAKDRTVGLVGFGIVLILAGAAALVLAAVTLASMAMVAAQIQDSREMARAAAGSAASLVVAAVVLVVLGIGSIQGRRWARALALAASWVWLLWGMTILAETGPAVWSSFGDHGSMGRQIQVVVVVTLALLVLAFLVVPAVLVAFYSSRHVRDTCARRDPVSRWTDACPAPVLACSVGLVSLSAAFAYGAAMGGTAYVFGHPFTGAAAHLVPGAGALLLLVLAVALGRLSWVGWWGTWAAIAVGTSSLVVTHVAGSAAAGGGHVHSMSVTMADPAEAEAPTTGEPAGSDEEVSGEEAVDEAVLDEEGLESEGEVLAVSANLSLFSGPRGAWITGAMGLALLAWLHALRRYFPGRPRREARSGAAPIGAAAP